jgi:N-acyl homoserine lactone hydrolase
MTWLRVGVVLGLACLALNACAPAGNEQAAPAAPAAPDIALYALDCGRIVTSDAGPFSDDHSYDGQTRELVDPCYLIRHPRGDLLWDTGFPEAVAAMPQGLSNGPFHITLARTLSAQLSDLGLQPADIELLSVSHSHSDHVGNANLFAGATWIVDRDERDYMFSQEARANLQEFTAYERLETARTTLIEGADDYDVFGDGAVKIIQAPGHTPGHTVLLVRLASGPVLLAGDLWHFAESRPARRVPVFNTDRQQTLDSMDKIEGVVSQTRARVVLQHVPEDFASLPRFPAPLR